MSAAVCIYLLLAGEALVRYLYDKPVRRNAPSSDGNRCELDRGLKLMIVGLALDALFILIRSIYRTIVSHF